MARVNPSPSQKQRLLEANAFRCCVCKRSSVGFNFHHLDGDSANTVDQNLAVLCVEDHDKHHRPGEYEVQSNHLELDEDELRRLKGSWEAFVAEAKKPNPAVLATLSCYGTEELIHSLQLVMQWPNERIEYKRSFHLLDGDLDRLTDEIFKELTSIGSNVKMAVIDQPLPVEHCPCCGAGFSRTMQPAVVARLTNPAWETDSLCSIYVNPDQPSLALVFFLGEQELFSSSLHLCQGQHLHYSTDGVDERVPVKSKPSVRAQATQIVNHVLNEWVPAKIFIGTGDPDAPRLISDLELPKVWESRTANKSFQGTHRKRRAPELKR
jgi:hypothetical protein